MFRSRGFYSKVDTVVLAILLPYIKNTMVREKAAKAISQYHAKVEEAYTDAKAANTKVEEAYTAATTLREQRIIDLSSQLSLSRGTLSRRALYEAVLQKLHYEAKSQEAVMKPKYTSNFPGLKFNATNTEQWLKQHYLLLMSETGLPSCSQAAQCFNNHQMSTASGLYGDLCQDIHGSPLNLDGILQPSGLEKKRHDFLLCLGRMVLGLPVP